MKCPSCHGDVVQGKIVFEVAAMAPSLGVEERYAVMSRWDCLRDAAHSGVDWETTDEPPT